MFGMMVSGNVLITCHIRVKKVAVDNEVISEDGKVFCEIIII